MEKLDYNQSKYLCEHGVLLMYYCMECCERGCLEDEEQED
jgi:hypothetical protein